MSRKIALAGIFTGIAVVLTYMGVIMPTGKLTLFFLASLPVAFGIIECGPGVGISVYFAVCILSALTVGNIYGILPFVLFFGHYPLFKHFIEKGRPLLAEIMLKLAVFNISVLIGYLLFKRLFTPALPRQITGNAVLTAGFIAVLQLLFLIYDYAFSGVLLFYQSRLRIIRRR